MFNMVYLDDRREEKLCIEWEYLKKTPNNVGRFKVLARDRKRLFAVRWYIA